MTAESTTSSYPRRPTRWTVASEVFSFRPIVEDEMRSQMLAGFRADGAVWMPPPGPVYTPSPLARWHAAKAAAADVWANL